MYVVNRGQTMINTNRGLPPIYYLDAHGKQQ